MRPLDHFGEPRPAHGGLVAEGALNLLGRPDMDPLVVLVREAVQNSWDARQGRGQVGVDVQSRTLTTEQTNVARQQVFRQLPPVGLFNGGDVAATELTDVLELPKIEILAITDRGTSGLGGPVRADQPAALGEATDFVDLVFNIGQPPDKEMGGGTYGFGKTISYLVSQCRTVVIHTSTRYEGSVQQRLIVQSIGLQYAHNGKNYTGRHWWGTSSGHEIGPVVGDPAALLAAGLGLPTFDAHECGTTIAVLSPDYGGRTAPEAMRYIADAIAWHFWPKMTGESGRPPSMSFSVSCESHDVPIPRPDRTPPLQGFVHALQAVRDCETGAKKPGDFPMVHVFEVWSKRPKVRLGMLALHPVPVRPGRVESSSDEADEEAPAASPAPFEGSVHHIALMRRAELVVNYQPGPTLPSPVLGWCGVFRAAEVTDRAFAAAEPPTHDDWRPALVVDKRERSYVKVALREIRTFAESTFARPAVRRESAGEAVSAAVVAESLGGIVAPVTGSGVSLPKPERPDRGGVSRRRTAKVALSRSWLERRADPAYLTLRVEFSVEAATGTTKTALRVVAAAAAAEGTSAESEPPAGADVPTIEGFKRNGTFHPGDMLEVAADDSAHWTVEVLQPRGVATIVDIIPVPGEAR